MAKKRKWSYGSYGSTALGKGMSITGFDEYLAKAEVLGRDIGDLAKEAIDESVKPIVEDMLQGAGRHKDNGDVYNAIEAQPAEQDGNVISAKLGIDIERHPEAKHAVFQEYGGHQNKTFPDPFIRPAFDNNKGKVKAIQRRILKEAGIPVDK